MHHKQILWDGPPAPERIIRPMLHLQLVRHGRHPAVAVGRVVHRLGCAPRYRHCRDALEARQDPELRPLQTVTDGT